MWSRRTSRGLIIGEVTAETTALIVALAGVLGTLSATLVTQRAAFRVKQLETNDRQRERSEDRIESARQNALKERQTIYVDLNTEARRLRSLAYETFMLRYRGEDCDLTGLNELRASYRDALGRAQMVLSDRGLAVADEANNALALATWVARGNPNTAPLTEHVQRRPRVAGRSTAAVATAASPRSPRRSRGGAQVRRSLHGPRPVSY